MFYNTMSIAMEDPLDRRGITRKEDNSEKNEPNISFDSASSFNLRFRLTIRIGL
ncbi:hypothetical protein VCR14J2_390122 [Vibrio coralliirubri]|nr:hypothetical protein VCR6J2_200048 [Vibrio coralliirubri]CDT72707.1 hypothetical protein VCR26J2_350690 [Vibrio coralliirubri]CDT82955.1 hypothetical protein VCR29J2_690059 [Vibrio coralliirubri]CDT96399.1 hypothetical protein VCR3J2_420062 [Vibrio coralliirubri]CDU05117.1 hypothetical protein VCR14J2_390122 [Vibrio coralliirubri]